jgi:DNA-binding YbaB/EbfC family protein
MRNLQQMMSQVRKMQEQMQKQMEEMRVEASSGGGIIQARMNGQKHLLELKIDPEALKDMDVEMLQDLVVAAVNECTRRVDEEMQSKVASLTGGLGIPGMF